MRIVTLPGVLTPPSDCHLLAQIARERGLTAGAAVLDVFTGSGALAISAALDGARSATAVDISRRAIASVKINARLNGVHVRALRGDLFAPVDGERFDLVLANPPYVPGASDELPARGSARAWEGGRHGRLLVDRFCDEVERVLAPAGSALMVHSDLTGEQATLEAFRAAGLNARVVARQRGSFGKIVAARAELLRRNGVLAAERDEEEMLVFCATRVSGTHGTRR